MITLRINIQELKEIENPAQRLLNIFKLHPDWEELGDGELDPGQLVMHKSDLKQLTPTDFSNGAGLWLNKGPRCDDGLDIEVKRGTLTILTREEYRRMI